MIYLYLTFNTIIIDISDNGKGILIEPKDIEGLKNAIEKLSNIDPKSLKNKTIQVRNHIIEKYSRSRMLKAYDKIYNDLVDIK